LNLNGISADDFEARFNFEENFKLLLPPLGSGFQNYEVGDDGNYDDSFAGFFAKRNYDRKL
jgi:hypothetical protein